jgi:hypothetical protein
VRVWLKVEYEVRDDFLLALASLGCPDTDEARRTERETVVRTLREEVIFDTVRTVEGSRRRTMIAVEVALNALGPIPELVRVAVAFSSLLAV